jgi:N-acetylglucosamine kinase-like BadF-type ATPase
MNLYLGIDGGQSGTAALIGDETGRVVGAGHAGPCNHVGASEGRHKFLAAVGGSLREALSQAGVSGTAFGAACLGFSGGPADKDALVREVVRAQRYLITHDAQIALTGATAGGPGVVTIAGTGSIAYGRNGEGRTARAGGWGYIFGDEGGGFDLVRQALRAVLRNEEGWGPPTILRDGLLRATGARDANDLMHRFYTDQYPRDRIAALAGLAEEAAGAGDTVAIDILSRAAQALAILAGAVRGQLFGTGHGCDIRYAGGVFRCGPLRERFRMLVELEDGNHVSAPAFSPAAGALIEAYRLAGFACELKDVPKED